MKRLTLMLLITVLALFVIPAYAGMEDKSDQLSNNQSNVFSPGYINASKQKTDTIINQLNTKKSMMERSMDYIKSKLFNDVTEDASYKPSLELKNKKSGAESGGKNEAALTTKINIGVITADNTVIDNAITAISAASNVQKGSIAYEPLANGNIVFTWNAAGKLYYRIYDNSVSSLGSAFQVATQSVPTISKYAMKVLSDDKFVIGYGNDVYFQIFNSDGSKYGNEFSGQGVKFDGTGYHKMSLTNLSNGGFAVGYESRWHDNYLKIFNLQGGLVSTVSLKSFDSSANPGNTIIAGLSNGNIAVSWSTNSGSNIAIFDPFGKNTNLMKNVIPQTSLDNPAILALSNGGFVFSATGGIPYSKKPGILVANDCIQIYSSTGTLVATRYSNGPTVYDNYSSYHKMSLLSNGDFVVVSQEGAYSPSVGARIMLTVYSQDGAQLSNMMRLGNVAKGDISVRALYDGTIGINWYDGKNYMYAQYDVKPAALALYSSGSGASSLPSLVKDQILSIKPATGEFSSVYENGNKINLTEKPYESNVTSLKNVAIDSFYPNPFEATSDNAAILRSLIKNKDSSVLNSLIQPDTLEHNLNNSRSEAISALSILVKDFNAQEMEIALKLASILKNPTEDQKLILDTIQALLTETEKAINESGSPELKKASDDLLQMVAAVLIAQAMPDLLKEGDVSGIKNIFLELNSSKVKIMLEYNEAVNPYYSEIKHVLSKNIALLQLNNIVSKGMISEELARLEPSEIDKILEKLRKASDKSFEAEYILQQEAKLRKAYIEPNKRVLEEKMKTMMKEFTQRLSGILESTKK